MKKVTIQQTADHIEDVNKEIIKMWANLGGDTKQRAKSRPHANLNKTKNKCIHKQVVLEQDRTELARICQMLIDELNECEARVKVAEAVIGDLKSTELIDMLTRNERMKESMLQEIEDLQDRSQQLDEDIEGQEQELEKLDEFIGSENGLNQHKVSELENELTIGDQNIEHLLQVIAGMKERTDANETLLIQYDRELV